MTTTQLSRRPAPMTRSARLGRRTAVLIAAISGLLVAVTAVPAFAQPKPMGDGTDTSATTSPFVATTTAGGMSGWQIALIALGAALAAAVIAVVVDRKLAARRHPASTAS